MFHFVIPEKSFSFLSSISYSYGIIIFICYFYFIFVVCVYIFKLLFCIFRGQVATLPEKQFLYPYAYILCAFNNWKKKKKRFSENVNFPLLQAPSKCSVVCPLNSMLYYKFQNIAILTYCTFCVCIIITFSFFPVLLPLHIYMCVYIYICIYIKYINIYIVIYIKYIHKYTCVCVYIYTYIYIYVYI